MKLVLVDGEMSVRFQVWLPADTASMPVACDDPAVEAALCAIGQGCEVFLWGEDREPAKVSLECHEDDVTVESDERADG